MMHVTLEPVGGWCAWAPRWLRGTPAGKNTLPERRDKPQSRAAQLGGQAAAPWRLTPHLDEPRHQQAEAVRSPGFKSGHTPTSP